MRNSLCARMPWNVTATRRTMPGHEGMSARLRPEDHSEDDILSTDYLLPLGAAVGLRFCNYRACRRCVQPFFGHSFVPFDRGFVFATDECRESRVILLYLGMPVRHWVFGEVVECTAGMSFGYLLCSLGVCVFFFLLMLVFLKCVDAICPTLQCRN